MSIRRFAVCLASSFLLGLAPGASAAPCAGFTDVQDTDQFCIHIEWLRNRAITLGCTTAQYCPAQYVRRDQMAAFLYRLGVQNAFLQGGNAFGTTATLGTTDNRALQVNVNGARALLLAPASNTSFGSVPNLVGGHPTNRAQITCAGICLPTPEPLVGATIAGGGPGVTPNQVTDSFGVVGGGNANRAGNDNTDHLDARNATVSGGTGNTASGLWSTVGGGFANLASGALATVPGGGNNQATGAYSMAAGHRASANFDGCFVWGDNDNSDIECSAPNRFVARATGGVYLISQVFPSQTGVRLLPGATSWSMLSDRALKKNIVPVDAEAVLSRLMAMPIATWNLATQSSNIRHIGPMAQDFHAAFEVGEDEHLISTVDAQGVGLAAIQGLNRKLERHVVVLEARNASLERGLAEVAAVVRRLEARAR